MLNLASGMRKMFGRLRGDHAKSRAALLGAAGQLDGINRTTEEGFLKLGDRLASLLDSIKKMAQETAEVANLACSEAAVRAASTLEQIQAHSEQVERRSHGEIERLKQIVAKASAIRVELENVRGAVRTFGVVVMMTRIESSRLESRGGDFANLADDVKSLAVEIDARIEHMFAGADALRERADGILVRLTSVELAQNQNLRAMVTTALESSGSLERQRQLAVEASRRLGEEYEDSSRQLGGVVAGLQFHDITRQKIEHAVEALQQAAGRPREAGCVALLQAAQLRGAAQDFKASADGVRVSLERIARDAESMAEETQTLLGSSRGEESHNFFADMEAAFEGVLRMLAVGRTTDGALADAAAALHETVAKLMGFVDEVQGIGLRMQRVALNTAIRAVEIDDHGLALGELAQAISWLSGDVATRSEKLGESLHSMEARGDCGPEDADAATESGDRVEAVERSAHELRAAEGASIEGAERIAALSESLAWNVRRAVDEFGEQRSFLDGIEAAAAGLDEIADRLGGDARDLDDLRHRYTMDAERVVHDRISGENAPAVAAAAQETVSGGEEFGDNVELF